MKRTIIAMMAAMSLMGLSACDRKADDASAPPSSAPSSGATGSSTAPGMANDPAGNQASQNTSDAVPTQEQLNPAAPAGSPPSP